MRIKYFILTFIFFSSLFNTYAQNKADTVRKVSWAVRFGGGISSIEKNNNPKNNEDPYYSFNTATLNGGAFQVGAKLTTIPRKALSFSTELNYVVTQFHLKYTSWDGGLVGGTSYNADYTVISHKIQFAIMPKITIGKKKILYISLGLCATEPFYNSSKGIVKTLTWSSSGINTARDYNDNEIKPILNYIDFGAIGSLGFNIPIKNKIIPVEFRFQAGLLNKITILKTYSALLSISYPLGKTNAILQFNTD